MIVCVGSFLSFPTRYWINGHSFIAGELLRQGVRCHKDDNASLSVSDRKRCKPRPISSVRRSPDRAWIIGLWSYDPNFPRRIAPQSLCAVIIPSIRLEYCRNFIFRRNFPIHNLFQRPAELGVFCLTADKIAQIFGVRKHKRLRGKLHSISEKLITGTTYCASIEKGWFALLYEKFSTFLRLEICINRHKDLGLNKGLENLGALREKQVPATDRLGRPRSGTPQRPS